MKFSKYILACGCLCNVGFAAYAGEDAAITELRESIESLKSQVTALKAKDEAIEEQNQTFDKSLGDIKAQITETSQKLDTVSQKIESTQSANSGNGEENDQINTRLDNLETSLQEIKTSIPKAEELTEIKSSLTQTNASITNLTQEMEAQKAINEQQSLDLGKNEARIDKMERSNTTSAVANVAGGLLGSAIQGGLGLLSQKLNADSLKESIAKGDSTEELTKDMTPEEKLELEEIKQEIASGKSEQEVQEKLDVLKSKVADREEKQRKFPETIFYGIDPFDNSTILHLLNLGRNGEKIDPNVILESIVTSKKVNASTDYINTMIDYINIIYDWGQKGAKLQDVIKNIKIISSGAPKKIVKSDLLKQANSQVSIPLSSQTMPQSGVMNQFIKGVGNFASNAFPTISKGNQMPQNEMVTEQGNVSINQNSGNQGLGYEMSDQEVSSNVQTPIMQESNYLSQSVNGNQSQQNTNLLQTNTNDGNLINQMNESRLPQSESNPANVMQIDNGISNPQVMQEKNSVNQSQNSFSDQRQITQNNQETNPEITQNQRVINHGVTTASQNNSNDYVSVNQNSLAATPIVQNDTLIGQGTSNETQQRQENTPQSSTNVSSINQESSGQVMNSMISENQAIQVQETNNQPQQRQENASRSSNNITSMNQESSGQVMSSITSENQAAQVLEANNQSQQRQENASRSSNNVTSMNQGNGSQASAETLHKQEDVNSVNRNGTYSGNRTVENKVQREEAVTQSNSSGQVFARQQSGNQAADSTVQSRQKSSTIANAISSEPDTFDMTVMDIDDNNYYDVTKKKFMRIAKPSSRFPTTVVTQSKVKVNPLDSFSAQKAVKLSS